MPDLFHFLIFFTQNICCVFPGACPDFKTGLINGLLKSYKILDLNYSDIQSSYLPVEFSKLPRYLRNVSGDFEVASQPHYSIQAIIKNNFAVVTALLSWNNISLIHFGGNF